MQQITSDTELSQYLYNLTSHLKQAYSGTYYGVPEMAGKDLDLSFPAVEEMKVAASVREESTIGGMVSDEMGGAKEYTTTNIQVAGVDEADFVKNDGKYIYIVSGNTLSIVRAYPPQTASIVAQISLPGSVSDLFISGNRLIVFTERYDYTDNLVKSDISGPVSGQRTSAIVYDISDRSHPEKIREISAPGSYENARMIGDYIYFLTSDNRGSMDPRMPVIFDDAKEIRVGSVWCPPGYVNEFRLSTITSFSISGREKPEAVSFLLGRDNTLYVSPTDVFVAYQKDRYGLNSQYFVDDRLVEGEIAPSEQESVIHRFAINNGYISYKATGKVPGYLLNQFSLDQYNGNLRVATTKENWSSSVGKSSGVYVMNPDLEIIGKIEKLAPGEKIYSARFMGDVLYLVTFKQTDPLFVIDLSNPTKPGVLGELKIPGYSDYLHPLDRTHLIGIGKDTYTNSGGGVIPTGVKIALFDVSDMNNPRQIDSCVIGDKGSNSPVLTDHRAFVLDKNKNIMVLPIKEVTRTSGLGLGNKDAYKEDVWQGVYVYKIDPDRGFTEVGKVKHGTGSKDESWRSDLQVRRSVFMDTVLYTISDNMILGSDLKDLGSRLMKITLSSTPEDPWYTKPLWTLLTDQ